MEISLKKGRLTNNKGYNTKVLHRKQIKTLKVKYTFQYLLPLYANNNYLHVFIEK